MKLLCVFLGLVAATLGADNGCCWPEQMSALEGMMIGNSAGGKASVIMGNIGLSMDTAIKKTNSYVSLLIDQKTVNERLIQDFNEKTQYLILNGVCTKSALEEWKPPCLKNESYMFDTYVGGVPNTLGAKVYNVKEQGIDVYMVATNEKECVPITEAAYGTREGSSFVVTITYMNATRSVPDPSVFNVPAICDSAPTVPKTKTLGGGLLFH